MKFWIDDIRTSPSEKWNICRSVGAAIRALDMYYLEVDEINLDHDISHQVVLGTMSRPYPCEETFEAVARYILRLKQISPDWNPQITLHTSNPIGADRMKGLLEAAGFSVERKIVGGANRLETIL